MPRMDLNTRARIETQTARRRQIEEAQPRYVQIHCHLCNWASNGLTLQEASQANRQHEEDHPEYTEWTTLKVPLDEIVQVVHDHDCQMANCACRCGCTEGPFCQLTLGALCGVCSVREIRGDTQHGEKGEQR